MDGVRLRPGPRSAVFREKKPVNIVENFDISKIYDEISRLEGNSEVVWVGVSEAGVVDGRKLWK